MKRGNANGLNPTEYLMWRKSNLCFSDFLERKNAGEADYRYWGEYRFEDERAIDKLLAHSNRGLAEVWMLQHQEAESEE